MVIKATCCVFLLWAQYVLSNSFQKYQETIFSKTIAQDVEGLIEEYYHDLGTTISDFRQLNQIVLPLDKTTQGILFHYKPDQPVYHLKQNHALPLDEGTFDERWIRFTFTRAAGDCSNVHISSKSLFLGSLLAPRIPRGIRLTVRGNDTVHLLIKWFRINSFAQVFSVFDLVVPDNCTLYLTGIERRGYIRTEKLKTQMYFSHRNNRPVEFHGLIARKIYNLQNANFITRIEDFPVLNLKNRLGEFQFLATTRERYIIPQDSQIQLLMLPHDAMRLLFQKPTDCWVGEFDRPDLLIREIDDDTFEVVFEALPESERRPDWYFETARNCPFELLEMSRTLSSITSRNAKYLTRKSIDVVTLALNSKLIQRPERFRIVNENSYEYSIL